MDLAFVVDMSGSIGVSSRSIIQLVRHVVHGLPIALDRTRVALVTYTSTASVNFHLDAYKSKREILNALSFYQAGKVLAFINSYHSSASL